LRILADFTCTISAFTGTWESIGILRHEPSISNFIRPERRPLTGEERKLLEWLLANGTPEARPYLSQVADVNVVGKCTCGCPTIDLARGESAQRKTAPSTILADFVGKSPEGVEVGVIVHAREGEISELEVYAIPNWEGPFSLPFVESLKQF
jgi:hypothetical protein